ncbi:ATP-grasp domain-containing protein [Mixta calida]|uniref:ATP-grasp domain-containing protein n=1 Tax=Mixta calida TaxID=665913 RepID=UPI0034D501BE
MNKAIWFMEGVSSQKDILAAVRRIRFDRQQAFTLIASHRENRPEILAEADFAYQEPRETGALLPFITAVVRKHNVVAIHAGKRGAWFEPFRSDIEALGVRLTTGATEQETFRIADDKALFSERMAEAGLPSVPSLKVTTPDEIMAALASPLFTDQEPCIKPVQGIYGMGFWILRESAGRLKCFSNPDDRIAHPETYLSALRSAATAGERLPTQIVMPYLPGPERSVDMLVENGCVLVAVARCKEGRIQTLENTGPAYDLATTCAQILGADGLINIQTRNDADNRPVLLEVNLRPSGGIGYTLHSGINLPGMFALRQLDLLTDAEISVSLSRFKATCVVPTNDVMSVPVCRTVSPDIFYTQD